MSPRARISAAVAACALAAAGVAVGVAALQGEDTRAGAAAAERPQGDPPLLLDVGGGPEAEARDLRRAERLYADGDRAEAERIFARHGSLEARIGLALARWPDGTVAALEELAREAPRRAIVRLNLGFALFWAGRREEAVAAWREATRVEPDSPAAVRADDLLHPAFARGLPVFVPSGEAEGRVGELLAEGVAHQRAGRPVSARRAFDAAAASASPDEAEPLVASAVGRFDKSDPAQAFSRLGPLARRFPQEPTVRFHLGLLLLWSGQLEEARDQLERAAALDADDPLAREAARLLSRLEDINATRDGS